MKKEVRYDKYVNPEPCTIVSCRDKDGRDNALAVGFIGNVSFDPKIIMIAIIDKRFSHHIIKEQKEFIVNIPTDEHIDLVRYLGTVSGYDVNKLENIETIDGDIVNAPIIVDCPVNFECKVIDSIKPGTHEVFFGRVEKVHCDEEYIDELGFIKWKEMNVLHSLNSNIM
ncbi:MAG: flavin reductase family protein [Methanobrevibacter wolinii]|nr:flavin reductase family protein [Methanobrevibacter wolinii]